MTAFEKQIIEIFNEGDHIVSVIRKHHFEKELANSFSVIMKEIDRGEYSVLPNLVGSVLVTINDKLRVINGEDKHILEQVSKILFEDPIHRLKQTKEGKECLSQCSYALEATCQYKGYDFQELNRMLELREFQVVRRNYTLKLPYYDWQSGNLTELDGLTRDLKDKEIIDGVINFKKLFSPITTNNFKFTAKREKIDYLLILFSILKQMNLIKPKVLSGHFSPIEQFGLDNGEKLFQKKPNKLMEKLKRDQARYTRIHNEILRSVKFNCANSIETMERQPRKS